MTKTSRKSRWGVGAALAVGAALVLGACGSASSGAGAGGSEPSVCPAGTTTVTAHGHGATQGPPDLLTVSLGVQTSAPSAAAALADNSSAAGALIAELKKDGVASADLQTSGLSIQPMYTGPRPVITGYQVTNSVTARIHNLAGAGGLIDDAARAAGNAIQVNQMAFSIQDDSALSSQARQAAVRQAADQARAMATGAGMHLGRLCSLSDQSATQPQPVGGFVAGGTGASSAGGVTAPIEAGSQQVTADVTAVYQLRP